MSLAMLKVLSLKATQAYTLTPPRNHRYQVLIATVWRKILITFSVLMPPRFSASFSRFLILYTSIRGFMSFYDTLPRLRRQSKHLLLKEIMISLRIMI